MILARGHEYGFSRPEFCKTVGQRFWSHAGVLFTVAAVAAIALHCNLAAAENAIARGYAQRIYARNSTSFRVRRMAGSTCPSIGYS